MNSDRFTKVFVSYTLRDACVTVEKLRVLKRQLPLGYDSFVDIIDNDSEDKQERVDYELEHCKKCFWSSLKISKIQIGLGMNFLRLGV